jgi:hypothetical protein
MVNLMMRILGILPVAALDRVGDTSRNPSLVRGLGESRTRGPIARQQAFWRKRSEAFRERETEREYRLLRVHWCSITDKYELKGSEQARCRFKILAAIAARGLSNHKGAELWKLWLAEVIQNRINYDEKPYTLRCPQDYLNNPENALRSSGDVLPVVKGRKDDRTVVFEGVMATVDRLFDASAIVCELLESIAKPRATKVAARSPRYKAIDDTLRDIAQMTPRRHDDVFQNLDGRVKIPNAEPFHAAGGWVKGFNTDRRAARAWLSKAWSRLKLPPFPRGPK